MLDSQDYGNIKITQHSLKVNVENVKNVEVRHYTV